MRTTAIHWTLISGLTSFALAACSGGTSNDPSPADVPEGTASAALSAPPDTTAPAEHHDPAKFIQHFDKNGDGKLEVAELPERMQKFVGKADTNGDGVLTVEELTTARDGFVKARFARGDKNGDGMLTEDEIGARRWAFIKVADADNNGSVTLAEIQTAIADGKLRFPHHGHRHHHDGDTTAPADGTAAPANG